MDILLLLIFLLISFAFGLRILKLLKFEFDDLKETIVFSLLLGLGVIAYLVYALGLAGFLYNKVLLLLLAVLAIFSFREIIFIKENSLRLLGSFNIRKLSLSSKTFIALIFSVVLFTFIDALSPHIGNDSLAYRLAQVQIFAESHKVFYIPYTRESLWPYLTEMLFTLALVIKSDIFAKLIAWSIGLSGAFLVYIFSRKFFSKEAGALSALIFLITPVVFTQMSYTYTDLTIAVYCFASVFCVLNYFHNKNIKWCALAGVFCGFVLSMKYTALLILPALGLVFIYQFIVEPKARKNIIKGALVFSALAVLFSFLWYLRAYLIKGNPVYPFFARYFGHHGWDRPIDKNMGSSFSLLGLLKLPWSLTMFPGRFGAEDIGVVYLLFLPLSFLITKSKSVFKALGVFTITYTVFWFLVFSNVLRCLLPALLPLSVLVGCPASAIFAKKSYFSNLLKCLFIIICIFNIGHLVYYSADKLSVAVGLESRDEYLSRTERTYKIADYINNALPKDAVILMVGEIRAYYMKRPYVHLANLIDEDKIEPSMLKTKAFLNEIKNKYRIRYIFYSDRGAAYPWLEPVIRRDEPMFRHDFTDKDGKKISCMLYDLQRSE